MIGPQFPDEAPPVVTSRTLRQFAGLCLAIFGTLFAWSGYQHHGAPTTSAWIALVVALVVGLPGLVYPPAVRPVFLSVSALTQPIGHVISTVLLGLIYYGLITPMALVFRNAGRDPLARRSPALATYWEPKNEPRDVRRYLHQYQRQSRVAPLPTQGVDHGTPRPDH
jgi:Saxitoxin biosynthesis operon protein SxtJ